MVVRGIGDLRNENANNRPNSRPMPNAYTGMNGANIAQLPNDPEGGPVAQMYPTLFKFIVRDFDKNTFIYWITIIQIIMFFVELIYGALYDTGPFDKNNTMAGPGTETMLALGAKDTGKIQHGQIYRLVLPAILHGGILHIFQNLIVQSMFCYTYEKLWGTGRIAYFYLLTAIGASCMSAVTSPTSVSVGASGSLMGMFGCQMSYLIMNWDSNAYSRMNFSQPNQGQQQQQQQMGGMGAPKANQMEMCYLICIILFTFSMGGVGSEGAHVDNMAHLGGLISGVLVGFVFVAKIDQPASLCANEQYTKMFFLLGSLAYYGSLLGELFFGMTQYPA